MCDLELQWEKKCREAEDECSDNEKCVRQGTSEDLARVKDTCEHINVYKDIQHKNPQNRQIERATTILCVLICPHRRGWGIILLFLKQLVNSFNCRNRIPVFAAWAKSLATHKVPVSSRVFTREKTNCLKHFQLKACNTWDGGGVYKHTFPPKASGLLYDSGTGINVWQNVLFPWHKGFNQFVVRKDRLPSDFEQALKGRIPG